MWRIGIACDEFLHRTFPQAESRVMIRHQFTRSQTGGHPMTTFIIASLPSDPARG